MDFGKVTTCAHCGRQFKALLEKHDEQDCIDGLLAENARLRERLKQWESQDIHEAMECHQETERLALVCEEAQAEVKRLRAPVEGHPGMCCGQCASRIADAEAKVKRLEGLILDFDYWHSHQATAKEAPDELIVEARRIRAARSGSEGSE